MKNLSKTDADREALQALTDDPAVRAYVANLKSRHGSYTAEEARRAVDADMKDTTLTELLYKMRNEEGAQ